MWDQALSVLVHNLGLGVTHDGVCSENISLNAG